MKNLTKHNQKLKADESDDDDDELCSSKKTLGYFVKTRQSNLITVYLDQAIVQPDYYRNVFNMLLEAGEEDQVMFMMNSGGGRLDGMNMLIEGVKLTDATTVAVIVGECHSAASIFALHCDNVQVLESATMLCHQVSFGIGGKQSDVLSHVAHVSKTSEKLLRETYKYFLTEQEITEMLSGREIYLDSDEIIIRLHNKAEALEKEQEEQALLEETKPAPKRRSKKTD